MKKVIIYCILILSLGACEKENESNTDSLNASGIKDNTNEIINIELKSGKTNTTNIDCYVFSSTLFEPNTSSFGYVDCNSDFNLVNLLTGKLICKYPLPGFLSQTVVDVDENTLIGRYYKNNTNYVIKLSLDDGVILANNSVDLGEGIVACTYFFNPTEKEYVLLKADKSLISINPNNGSIKKSIKAESLISNAVFDVISNRLIGITYSPATDQNYIEVLNVETGALISKVEIKERNDYYGCVSGFDSDTNCYILVNPQNEILFIDIESGELKDSYQLDFEVKKLKFWRNIQ